MCSFDEDEPTIIDAIRSILNPDRPRLRVMVRIIMVYWITLLLLYVFLGLTPIVKVSDAPGVSSGDFVLVNPFGDPKPGDMISVKHMTYSVLYKVVNRTGDNIVVEYKTLLPSIAGNNTKNLSRDKITGVVIGIIPSGIGMLLFIYIPALLTMSFMFLRQYRYDSVDSIVFGIIGILLTAILMNFLDPAVSSMITFTFTVSLAVAMIISIAVSSTPEKASEYSVITIAGIILVFLTFIANLSVAEARGSFTVEVNKRHITVYAGEPVSLWWHYSGLTLSPGVFKIYVNGSHLGDYDDPPATIKLSSAGNYTVTIAYVTEAPVVSGRPLDNIIITVKPRPVELKVRYSIKTINSTSNSTTVGIVLSVVPIDTRLANRGKLKIVEGNITVYLNGEQCQILEAPFYDVVIIARIPANLTLVFTPESPDVYSSASYETTVETIICSDC